jgi:conjugal transfer pilus assembly protein TraK
MNLFKFLNRFFYGSTGFLLFAIATIIFTVFPYQLGMAKAMDDVDRHGVQSISFAENDQLTLMLSTVDANRLFVDGDRINAVNAPVGYIAAKNDDSGSVYLNVQVKQPFTVFITTALGRHFSVLVIPKAVIGKTYELKPTGPTVAATMWEKNTGYEKILSDLIKGMETRQPPEGYGFQAMDKTKLTAKDFYGVADLLLIEIYPGSQLIGHVYVIQNKTKKPLTLSENMFYERGVRAVALSQQTVAPGQSSMVYQVRSSS